ncbi:Vitamin D3 receptor B [Halotydeus destructor]|nr:Vitamin D3 receptor B [Halotydeus destructor]
MLAGHFYPFDDSRVSSLLHPTPGDLRPGAGLLPPTLDHRASLSYWDIPTFVPPPPAGAGPNPASFTAPKTGMSLPSPDGSTSSVLSSDDSSPSTPRHLFGTPSSSAALHGPGRAIVKICGVCGDRAKSYHFGGISCDSCKAFFRRSVQNDAYKSFHCPYESHCDINISSRKCCQYCRFHKCLSIGMEKSWVMTEEERLHMLKTRLEKRQKQEVDEGSVSGSSPAKRLNRLKHHYEADVNLIGSYLSQRDVNTIETLMNEYILCIKELLLRTSLVSSSSSSSQQPTIARAPKLPSSSSSSSTASSSSPSSCPPSSTEQCKSRPELLDMFFTAIQRLALFAQKVPSFSAIEPEDQQVLLRGSILEMGFVLSSHLYDTVNSCWPDSSSRFKGTDGSGNNPLTGNTFAPVLTANDLKPLVNQDLYEKHMTFIKSIKSMDIDEVCIILLTVIVLLSPDRTSLSNCRAVSQAQERYLMLLRSYMTWRFGHSVAAILYPKLLLKMPDLRELAETLTDFQLSLGKQEIEQIHQRLSSLKLDKQVPSDQGGHFVWSLRRDALSLPYPLAPTGQRESPYCPENDDMSTSSEWSEKYLNSD